MTPSTSERVTRLEERSKSRDEDIKEIKEAIKGLETIASRGKGALGSALFIGGVLGWFVSIAVAIYAAFRH